MNLFNKANKRKVDEWLADPTFRSIVEGDIGVPIKVKVLWERGVIRFQGPHEGREIAIQDILDAYGEQRLH